MLTAKARSDNRKTQTARKDAGIRQQCTGSDPPWRAYARRQLAAERTGHRNTLSTLFAPGLCDTFADWLQWSAAGDPWHNGCVYARPDSCTRANAHAACTVANGSSRTDRRHLPADRQYPAAAATTTSTPDGTGWSVSGSASCARTACMVALAQHRPGRAACRAERVLRAEHSACYTAATSRLPANGTLPDKHVANDVIISQLRA